VASRDAERELRVRLLPSSLRRRRLLLRPRERERLRRFRTLRFS